MSPIHENLSQVESDIQKLVRAELDAMGSDMTALALSGYAFVVIGLGEERSIRLEDVSELSKSQLADAKKLNSARHIISPIHDRSKHSKHDVDHGGGRDRKNQIRGGRSSR